MSSAGTRRVRTWAAATVVTLALVASAPARAQSIAVTGDEHRCTLTDGRVRCEGWSYRGGCDRSGGEIQIALPEPAIAIDAGAGLACAITTSHELFCWGWEETSIRRPERACPAPQLTPREITGMRGRVSAIAMAGDRVCVLLTDETVSCWGDPSSSLGRGPIEGSHYDHVPGPIASSGEDVRRVIREDGTDLDRVLHVTALHHGACAIDADHTLWCWGWGASALDVIPGCTESSPCTSARRMSFGIAATELRCGLGGCCAIGAEREIECWGPAAPFVRELVEEHDDWIDVAPDARGACIATRGGVECTGSMRPEADRAPWDGFRVRGGSVLRLDAHLGSVCATTTRGPVCWGSSDLPDRGRERVTPRIARTHWRLRSGERALRTRVVPIRCGDEATSGGDPRTAIEARSTTRGLRVEVSRLLYNCGHAPHIDARLRADGSIELGIGYPRPSRGRVVWARCDCLYDLVVWIEGVPAGEREIVLESEDGSEAVRAATRGSR